MVENLNTLISSAPSALSVTWDQRELVPGTLIEEPVLMRIHDYFEQIAAGSSVPVNLAVNMYLVHFVERVISG